jgi:hypothetical protein
MDSSDRTSQVLKLLNLARATYGASELKSLSGGELHSAPFCPIGRSLRVGVEDWLFVTVGSKHLRLWTVGQDSVTIAKRIMTAWAIPHEQLRQSRDRPGVAMLPLPSELREFINRFDRGLLPAHQGPLDQSEVQHLRELASGMPMPSRPRNKAIAEASRDSVKTRGKPLVFPANIMARGAL